MEIRQLQLFRILARELSFTRAAKRAHCVQSNVSVQVRSLEEELGVLLFERLGKQVRLTGHGERLLPYAERVLDLLEESRIAVTGKQKPTGRLAIGAPESVLTYRLPPVLQQFRSDFPAVDLIFRATGKSELASQLEHGDIDVGIVIDDELKEPRLHTEVICPEALTIFSHPRHPLAGKPTVEPADFREQTFLLTDQGCAYRLKLERALAAFQVSPQTVMEFTSVETIKQYAALEMGIACLPAVVVKEEIRKGKLVDLSWRGPDLIMKTQVAWHKNKWLSPTMQAFLELLRKSAVAGYDAA
ncbi:MAG: LysR family transcriptional regulator [Acidobacteria bacterium]|nr:LysR family transcriptional regulator [Acidobacteriota bacterium]